MTARMALALEQDAELGEGLLWHPEQRCWWWTDIEAAVLHAWPAQGGAVRSYRLPERLGSFAHCRSGRLLLGLEKRLCLADAPPGSAGGLALQELTKVEADLSGTRVNDGRTDRHGFFVFGTLHEPQDRQPVGSFYQFSLQHGLRRLALPGVAIANSICFSLDGGTMYFTDTPTRRIMQCDYHAPSAQVGNVRLFAQVDAAHAFPDGSVIDAEGCLWNAQWGAARVVRYAPDGRMLRSVAVPARQPTCPAFGGEGLRQLMVTTARQQMSREELQHYPQSGSLFILESLDAVGVADTPFNDE